MDSPHADLRKWPQWQNPPWILSAYLVFAVLATVLQCSTFYAPKFSEKIVPIVGWGFLGHYSWTLFFVIMAMIFPKLGTVSVESFLFIGAAFGVVDLCLHLSMRENFGNPYLTYSPWRPLITIALPLFWGCMLRWFPSMTRWKNQVRRESDEK